MAVVGAFGGLRVVDLTDGPAGFAGRLLADLGAEVIQVDPRARLRSDAPNDLAEQLRRWHYRIGKRSVLLEPDDPRLAALIDTADVVIAETGPDHPPATFDRNRPWLIVATVSGFGDGPKGHWRATERIAQAAGGMVYVNGRPDEPPIPLPGDQAHLLAGHYLLSGVLMALRVQRATGHGQGVSVTLQEAVASAIEHVGVWRHYEQGRIARRLGDLHWVRGYGVFPCADGWACLSWNRNWDHLVALLAADDAAAELGDAPYATTPAAEFTDAMVARTRAVLSAWTATRTRREVFERGQLFRLPWAPVNTFHDALHDPHLAERQFFVTLPGPDGVPTPATSGPARLTATPWRPTRRAPFPGEDQALLEALPPRPRDSRHPSHAGRPALAGLRVLDFTWVLAGPFATRLLGDHGADVIKVQTDGKLVGYVNDGYFTTWNRNKRGVTLNLGTAEGRAIARRLVQRADVVVDNFSARVMRQWGMDDGSLLAINPRLIVAHLSGMGHSGPYEHYVSYGPTAQALAGITAAMTDSHGVPVGVGFSYSDHVAGLTLASAILAALAERDATGVGQVIDLSQFESTASFLGPEYAAAARRVSLTEPDRGLSTIVRCRGDDRWIAIEARGEDQLRALRAVLGSKQTLAVAVSSWAAQQEAHEAASRLQAAGVPASVVADAEDLIARDDHLQARGFWWRANHPQFGVTPFDGTPIRLSLTPAPPPTPSPMLGEHNDAVYGELLGLTTSEIRDLESRGVFQ